MIQLKINSTEITVPQGTTILNAAKSLGIDIPTMCYLEGNSNHPSCMVCVVKDNHSGMLYPSCAMPVTQSMDILTDSEEVLNARREALELLLSDHVGDCEAPCRIACPAFMDIPKMNRFIASGDFFSALKVVKEEIALPSILGYICSAPCEKVCRRKQVDSTVSICLLKRFTAVYNAEGKSPYFPQKDLSTGKKVAIIGSGPAGLSCAFHLLKLGYSVVIYDSHSEAGGSLLNLPESELPKVALSDEVKLIKDFGAEFKFGYQVTPEIFKSEIKTTYDAVVFATGDIDESSITEFDFKTNAKGFVVDGDFKVDSTGIFACGSAIRPLKMAVKAVAQGKETAFAVNKFLGGKSVDNRYDRFNSKFGLLQEPEISEYLKEAENKAGDVKPEGGKLAGFTAQEAIAEAKRCMHCDCRKPDSCKLRTYADEYKADRKKYALGTRSTLKKYFQHNEVVYEPEKCIRCGLCIEIATMHKEEIGLTYIGRGFDVRVEIPFHLQLDKALTKAAMECANACPTGAIAVR
jgi:NADPH-dependent glutamate synthase beta subunit-like oxidoreductase